MTDKKLAYRAMNAEIRHGRMVKASTLKCLHCEKQAHDYHHHNGYSPEHWLDVIPLCKACHNRAHVFKGRGKRSKGEVSNIRILGVHEVLLRKLTKCYGQPTAASMVRIWIHNAAKEAGLIPLSSATVDVGSQQAS